MTHAHVELVGRVATTPVRATVGARQVTTSASRSTGLFRPLVLDTPTTVSLRLHLGPRHSTTSAPLTKGQTVISQGAWIPAPPRTPD